MNQEAKDAIADDTILDEAHDCQDCSNARLIDRQRVKIQELIEKVAALKCPESELASIADVLNTELRINGPIEVEQYNAGQIRSGIMKLVDYMRAKIDRRDLELGALRSKVSAFKEELAGVIRGER